MINWNKITKKDTKKISAIAKRAINEFGGDRMNCEMDISAAHLSNKLDLDALFEADRSNFSHDIYGIMNNLNRETGLIENCFRPRFSA